MRFMRLTKILPVFIVFTLLATVMFIFPVNAESANAAQGIEISPASVELNAARGQTYDINLKITNVTASSLVYSTSVNDFSSADETGAPSISFDSVLPKTASITTWVQTIPEFELKSHEQRTVTVKIVVPNNAEPGGHYGVVSFSGKAPSLESTGVGLNASAGALILIRVDGDIVEKASLSSFYSAQDNKQNWFFEYSPITFVTRIKNEGNIHVKPVGNVEIHDMFGNIVKTLEVGDVKSSVLPSSIRRFDAQYDGSWMFGKYTANLMIGYGTTGQAITSTIDFWVIPYKLILAVIFIAATVIYVLRRLISVYNKRIIEKAKNEIKNKNKKHESDKN